MTFDRLELQGKLLALEVAIASGEGERARVLVAELLQLASVASSTDPTEG